MGAGFGGITAALTLKTLRPQAEVVVVEPAPYFISAPGSLGYLFGLVPFPAITRSYTILSDKGLRLIRASVQAVDAARKIVATSAGLVGYDYLLVATGLRLVYDDIPGLAQQPDAHVSFFDSSPSLVDARRRIAAFRGGHVVVTTPVSAYKCPPAPYEYALLWADSLRRRRLSGRITLIDPRPRPTPPSLAPGFLKAMDAHGDRLRYESFTRLVSVDLQARTIETDSGKVSFDLLSVVPTNAPVAFLAEAGLGDGFIDVDPTTFRSMKDPAVYAVGDTADTPFAKTAATAISSARIAARHVAHALGASLGDPRHPSNVCYPLVSFDRALRLRTEWSSRLAAEGAPDVTSSSTSDNEASTAHRQARRRWEATALREMFGR